MTRRNTSIVQRPHALRRLAATAVTAGVALTTSGCSDLLQPGRHAALPIDLQEQIDPTRELADYRAGSAQPIPKPLVDNLVGSMASFDPDYGYDVMEWITASDAGMALVDRINAQFNTTLTNNPTNTNPDLAGWHNANIVNGKISGGVLRDFQKFVTTAWTATPQVAGVLPSEAQYLPVYQAGDLARQATDIAVCLQVATGEPQFSAAMNAIAEKGEGAFPTPNQRRLGLAAYKNYTKLVATLNKGLADRAEAVQILKGPSTTVPTLELQAFARQGAQVSFLVAIAAQARPPASAPAAGR